MEPRKGSGQLLSWLLSSQRCSFFSHGVRCVLAEPRYPGLPEGRRHWSGGHVVWYAWIW